MKVARFVCAFVLFAVATALAQNPVPFINQPLVPDAVAPGGPAFTLTVNGTEFVPTSVVNWNGAVLSTTFVSSSQLTATVPATDVATAGTASITVTNPAPGGGVSNVMFFDVANQASSLVFSDFYNPLSFAAFATVAADFNGDGKLDVASVTDAAVLVIALGNGDGTFQAPLQYPTGNLPYALVVADFNGDGNLDVAVANENDNTVSIFLGNGDGTFQAAKTFATGLSPFSIASGDFDGDGKLDLAVGCKGNPFGSGSISILLGNGDGTFQTHTDYTTGTSQSVDAMTMGDFNGDGNLDVALVDNRSGGELFMLLGNGDGTFHFTSPVPTTFADSMLAADVNSDGKLDLVIALYQPPAGDVAVLIGNGDGTFQPAVEYSTGGGLPLDVVAGDFNADGKLDLATPNQDSNTIGILLGNGDGTFQSPTTFPVNTLPNSTEPLAVAAGDFNGDGEIDVAVTLAGSTGNSLLVLLQGNWPALAAVPPSVDFGQQNVDTLSAPQSVALTNTGSAIFEISSISIAGANAGDFSENNTCGPTLAPNASCQVNVTFTPSLPGTRNAMVGVATNSFNHPINVPLTGIGYGALVSLSPPTVTFPAQDVGTSGLPQTVTVTNAGTATLTISNVNTSLADFGTLSNCSNSIPPNTNCTIGVFFDPTASGTRTGTLTVSGNASDSPQSITLSGVGQDFSMASSGSATATVSPGGSAKYTLAVAPAGGFKQTVSFTCSGAPEGLVCSVPGSVMLNGSSTTMVTVTVASGTSARLARPGFTPVGSRLAMWLALGGLPGLVIFGGSRRRRGRRMLCGLALVCLFPLALAWTGCGGGSGGGQGTYNLTVSGRFTSGATTLTHDTKLTLVVQ